MYFLVKKEVHNYFDICHGINIDKKYVFNIHRNIILCLSYMKAETNLKTEFTLQK